MARTSVIDASKPGDMRQGYHPYSVHIDDHRVLAVVTHSPVVLSKWLNSVLNTPISAVGVTAARDSSDPSSPLDLISICTGSHCLIFLLPDPFHCPGRPSKNAAKHLSAFFGAPGVVAAAPDARRLSQTLLDIHGVSVPGLLEAELERHTAKITMYEGYDCSLLTHDMIKFSVLNSHLCFLIAFDFLRSSKHDQIKKKKKKKKKKKREKKEEEEVPIVEVVKVEEIVPVVEEEEEDVPIIAEDYAVDWVILYKCT